MHCMLSNKIKCLLLLTAISLAGIIIVIGQSETRDIVDKQQGEVKCGEIVR